MSEAPHTKSRLSLSEILSLMLQRSGPDRSGVTLTWNAKGDTQVEVVATASEGDVEGAAERAAEVYDGLRARYPRTTVEESVDTRGRRTRRTALKDAASA